MDEQPKVETTKPDKPKPAHPQQRSLLVVLTLGLVAGLGSSLFVFFHARDGAEIAAQFGMELQPMAQLYVKAGAFAFAFPAVVFAAAMAITRLGRTQENVGKMLIALLFGFALIWPLGAFVAFQMAYDPPRTPHGRQGMDLN
jgi:hypothetical protein